MKIIMFSFKFHWQYISIGSGNGLVPNRQQAITWTNDDQIPSLGYNELKAPTPVNNFVLINTKQVYVDSTAPWCVDVMA